MLALGRTNPLKNLPLTLAAWRALHRAAPGAVPVRDRAGARARRACATSSRPSDEQVNELFCQATVFVQTSTHEGFALPPLEAMATGGAVVCTDAHGNRDFCVDGVNCLMPEPNAGRGRRGARRACSATPSCASALGRAGIETAQEYAWERRIDALEEFFEKVAASRRMALSGELAPEISANASG